MADIHTLGLRVDARQGKAELDQFAGKAAKAGAAGDAAAKKTKLFGASIKGLAVTASATAGVLALMRSIRSLTVAAAEFDQAMTKSLAIMGDVSDMMRDRMAEEAKRVGVEMNLGAKEAADSYFYLASAGFSAEQSVKALSTVATFAKAGMFDMALATDLATDAQSALGLKSRDATENMAQLTRVTDVLVKANTLANATVEQFATSLTTEAGAALRAVGKDMEEGVAVLAAFADQGVKAQVAGTGLSRIIRLMSKAALDNAEAYERHNVAVFDARGEMRNFADIIADLETALGGMSDQTKAATLTQLGFQARVQGVILPLLGTSEAVRKYEEQLRAAGGTTKDVAEKQMQTPLERLGVATKDIVVDLMAVGNTILSAVVPAVETLAKNMDLLLVPLTAVTLMAGQLAVVKLAPMAVAAATAFSGWASAAGTAAVATGTLSGAITALWAALGPAGWLIAGITALVAALVLLKRRQSEANEELRQAAEDYERLRGAVSQMTTQQLLASRAMLAAAQSRQRLALQEAIGTDQQEQLTRKLAQTNQLYRDVNDALLERQKLSTGISNVLEAESEAADKVASAYDRMIDKLKELKQAQEDAFIETAARRMMQGGGGLVDSMQGPVGYDLGEIEAQLAIVSESMTGVADAGLDLADALQKVAPGLEAGVSGFLNLADALDLLGDDARQALRGIQAMAQGIQSIQAGGSANILGGAFGIAGGVAALMSGLFSRDEEKARLDRERNEILKRNQTALDEIAAGTGGTWRTDQGLAQVGQYAQILQNFQNAQWAGLLTMMQQQLEATGLTLVEFEARAEELGITLRDSAGRMIPEALQQLVEMSEAARAALQQETEEYVKSLRVRELRAQGEHEAAETERIRLEQLAEVQELRNRGLGEEAIEALQAVHALEDLAREREKEAAAALREAEAERELANMRKQALAITEDVRLRELALDETTEGKRKYIAESMRARGDAELAAAQRLVDASAMTEAEFLSLARVIDEEITRALRDYDRELQEAANREARRLEEQARREEEAARRVEEANERAREAELARVAAMEKAMLVASEDLEVRELLLQGDVRAAKIREKELQQQREWDRFVEMDMSEKFMARLADVQAGEMANFVAGLQEIVKAEQEQDRIRTGSAAGTAGDDSAAVHGARTITQGQASSLVGLEREQVAILRAIEQNTRPFGVSAPNFSRPILGSSGSGMSVVVNVNGPVTAGSVKDFSDEVASEVLAAIDHGLGESQNIRSIHKTGAGQTP